MVEKAENLIADYKAITLKDSQNFEEFYSKYSTMILNFNENIDNLRNLYYSMISEDLVIKKLAEAAYQKPNKVAVSDGETEFTYSQLQEESDKIASRLFESQASEVILSLKPSSLLIIIIIGIYKSGKTYVPLNYDLVDKEKKAIYSKFDQPLIITEENYLNYYDESKWYGYPKFYPESELAYIIHTSGTTGIPKGVMVTRKNLNYILDNIQEKYKVFEDSVYLFSTPISFDVSITEIFGFLQGKGKVYVKKIDKLFLRTFSEVIVQKRITHFACSPSVLEILLMRLTQEEINNIEMSLCYVVVAGESFRISLLPFLKKFSKAQFFNAYGPTETTIYAFDYKLDLNKEYEKIPIGLPFSGVKIFLLPYQNVFRLFIGGEGVSRGYYKDEERTKKFFKIIDGMRYYDTGDLVEKKGESYFYCGRIDSQVQINGIRLELEEVEFLIQEIISEPILLKVISFSGMLVMFYKSEEEINFREMLKGNISKYKIPSKFIRIPFFPLTLNNKVDIENLKNHYLR